MVLDCWHILVVWALAEVAPCMVLPFQAVLGTASAECSQAEKQVAAPTFVGTANLAPEATFKYWAQKERPTKYRPEQSLKAWSRARGARLLRYH